MAVMTTQHLESLGLEEKPAKAVPATNDDGRNGIPEVNGHAAPAKPDSAPSPSKVANSETANDDAFLTNQDISGKPNGNEHTKNDATPEATKVEEDPPAENDPFADTDMTDAPAKSPTPQVPEQPTEDKPKSPAAAPLPALDISTAVAATSPASSAISPRTKEDVVMGEADERLADNSGAVNPGSTQETATGDVATESPAAPAEESTKVPDAPSAASPSAPPTADTSMSEPSQRLTREREADSEDEPAAKRTKIAEAPVATQDRAAHGGDRMDVDQATGSPSLYRANGEPKHLADVTLHPHELTDHMAKALRNILAGVKKTKAGAVFRLPVREIWPGLWNDYSAKVPHPIDISTMEKKLRGDITPGYVTMGDFKNDVYQLVKNSILFNGEAHDVTMAAMTTRDSIFTRMAAQLAVEPVKPEKKDGAKQHTTRHAEPRATGVAVPKPAPAPKKAAVADKPPVVDSPAFAIPANNNGVPLIRRDSTKPDSRTKRPVKPAHPKDLVYDTKRKKLSPELRFCETVIEELKKAKYYDFNSSFMVPVDPVALNIPSYHKIVKKPMDLTTMSKKLAAGEYQSAKDFERDFDLIIKNCRLFNGDEHVIYKQALGLQQIFRREFGKKDDWMAKHVPVAPPPRRTASPAPKNHESDDEDAESDAEPEFDEEYKSTQGRLATIQKRLEAEQTKLSDMIKQGNVEMADVEISQSVIAMLQKQLIVESSKLSNMQPKKPTKGKPGKMKKAGGGTIPAKKVAVGGGSAVAGGPSKKGGTIKKATPKRKLTQAHKNTIAQALAELDGPALNRAIDIIKRDTGQGENDSGELELDIDVLSEEALLKLYDISIKAFPNLRITPEKNTAAPPPAESPVPRSKAAPAKTKKNKPMTKFEQERRIAQLNELRAQAGRQGSGSQEPMESIEGNGAAPAVAQPAAPAANVDSEDEESSEEE
ncbi:Bromodomain-containing factor 1 [Podospora conica]|nr:Bromodomain-containing factor 1 [Schizothecium conicum]